MAPLKAMPPPSPSSSGSESESSTSSSDEEEQQQKKKEAAQAKASPPPVKKKPVVPKQQQKTKPQQETASPSPAKKKPVVTKQQEKTKPREETASPSPAKKKPVLKNNKKPPPPVPRSAAVPSAAADDDSGGDEEPSDSPPEAKPFPSPSRLRSPKPSSSAEPISSFKREEPTPAAASQQLRTGKERKRQRQGAEDEQEGDAASASGPSSKKLFQRVWVEEDEIALLEGMLDFQEKHGGTRPVRDIDAFSKFISAALQGEFSKTQLYYKIRRLRNKYERNLRRGKKGADPSFTKPHEQAAFELSKKIWPTREGDAHDYRDDDTGIKSKDGGRKVGRQGAGPLYPRLTEAISLLEKEDGNTFLVQSASRALGSLKPTKAKALEDCWNKHFIAGVKYFMERARLKKELLQSLVKIVDTE